MPARGNIAYDPGGRIFVLADGEEILVHDGGSEAPLWREEHGEALVGVAIVGDDIVAVGEGGLVRRLTFLRREVSRASIGEGVSCFAVRGDGTLAAAHADHISLLRKHDLAPVPLYHRGVTALAWSGDGRRLLVGTTDGKSEHVLRWLDGASGEPVGEPTKAAARIEALAWSIAGHFLVASGDCVLRLGEPGGALAHVTRAKDQLITDVAASSDGKRFAIQVDRSMVAVLGVPPGEALFHIQYPQRVCAGVVFGPRPWIGIALAGGDANKCDVETGAVHRSDTHPGRAHQRWLVMSGGSALERNEPEPPPREDAERVLARAAEAREKALSQQRALDEAERQLRASRGPDAMDPKIAIRIGLLAIGILLALARACMH